MLGVEVDLSGLRRRVEEDKLMTKKAKTGGERLGYVS